MGEKRKIAREIARQFIARNDPLGWFEALYRQAGENLDIVPWADLRPNPSFVRWLNRHPVSGAGLSALKVGCGLGDDAEELARRGFRVTAFDISETAIAWCRRRFPGSSVSYRVEDLFVSPPSWREAFDFVLESYTLQVLPADLRPVAAGRIRRFVAPGGRLLVICRGREPGEDPGKMPWPLTRDELLPFAAGELVQEAFEDFTDDEEPPTRRFMAVFRARTSPVKKPAG
jgi:SAM-dependent methyltransferase